MFRNFEMSNEKELEVVEAEIFEFLPVCSLEELEGLFEIIGTPCPVTAKGKKNSMLKLLYKHLMELEGTEDGGFATLKLIHKKLTENPDGNKENTEVKLEQVETKTSADPKTSVSHQDDTMKKLGELLMSSLSSSVSASFGASNPGPVEGKEKKKVTEYVHRYQTLKLNGSIGAEKGNMTFTDLNFQVSNAQKQGFSVDSIRAAIIKQVEDEDLKTYFERKPDLTIEEIIDFLRPVFTEKDSAAYFTKLGNAVQKSSQSPVQFTYSLLSLKETAFDLSTEEGHPFEDKMLTKQMMKSLCNGIKNTNIRTEVREGCRGVEQIKDRELIKIVSEALTNEEDRARKFGKEVTFGEESDDGSELKPVLKKKKENLLPVQVQELKITHQKEIAALKTQFNEAQAENKANFDELKSLLTANCNLMAASSNNNPTAPIPLDPRAANFPPQAPNFSPLQALFPNVPQVYGSRNNNRRNRGKCQACVANNVFRCTHCLRCGSGEHRMINCTNNNNNIPQQQPQNGGSPNM